MKVAIDSTPIVTLAGVAVSVRVSAPANELVSVAAFASSAIDVSAFAVGARADRPHAVAKGKTTITVAKGWIAALHKHLCS
jgi:hypothetical protein